MASTQSRFGSREPPQPQMKEQYLFLLEFFVHCVTGDRLAKLNQMFFVPTSISFQFLNFRNADDVEVTPVDPLFEPQAGIADDVEYFYSGRSVMFAIAEEVAINQIADFKIDLLVRKRMPDEIKPDVMVGRGVLDMTAEYAKLKREMRQCWNKKIPPPKSVETEVPLTFDAEEVGAVLLYARMSAFGQTIVTEFDAPPAGKEVPSAYTFRGDEMDEKALIYKCRTIDPCDPVDICKDSEDDVRKDPPCPVCIPPSYPCLPCGLALGAVARPSTPVNATVDRRPMPRDDSTAAVASYPARDQLPIQTSRGPAQPCGKAVVLKVSGLLDEDGEDGKKKQPTVTVLPECDGTGPNNPCDPDHDVFILRIGKKGLVGVGEKSDIQLEMRTPKGPERRPPIRYETREAQTEEDKAKGKGKKGKGKKK